MKTFAVVLLLVAVIVGCNGQVQVPAGGNYQPAIDSLKARIVTLEARPVITFGGSADEFLTHAGTWVTAVAVKSGQATFSGTAYRKAVYVPGLTTAWRVFVQAIASTDTPPYEYILRREVKQDSIIVLRQPGGAANLTIEWLAVLP